jgi:hypothetical protein
VVSVPAEQHERGGTLSHQLVPAERGAADDLQLGRDRRRPVRLVHLGDRCRDGRPVPRRLARRARVERDGTRPQDVHRHARGGRKSACRKAALTSSPAARRPSTSARSRRAARPRS